MSGQYGEFSNSIVQLDTAQEQVKTVWRDEVAKSYDVMNDNIKLCAGKIWSLFCDSKAGIDAVKKSYDSEEVDKEISRFSIQIEQV